MRSFFVIGAGRVLLIALAIANVRFYTELLSAHEVGRLTLLLGFATVLSVLVDRSLGAYWYRMLLPWNESGRLPGHLARPVAWLVAVGVAVAASTALVADLLGLAAGAGLAWLAAVAFCGVVVNSLFSAVAGGLNILGERAAFVGMSVGGGAASLFLSAFMVTGRPSAEWWVAGVFLAQTLFVLPGGWFLRHRLRPASLAAAPEGFDARSWARFAGPAVVSAALYAAQLMGYRFVLNAAAGTTAVAYFTVAFGLGVAAMNAFDYLITQLVQPRFFRRLSDAGRDPVAMAAAWHAYARAVLPAVIIMAAFTGAAGPFLLRVGASASFGLAGRLVVWGVLTDALRIVSQLMSMVPHATLQTRRLIVPSAIAVAVSLVSGGLLAYPWPRVGMGMGLVLGGMLWVALSWRVARELLPVQVPWRAVIGSLAASVPLVLGLEAAVRLGATRETTTSLAVLAGAGGVMVAIQYAFARRWIADTSVSARRADSPPDPPAA